MYGYDFFVWNYKVPFEIPYKISYPYIERYNFYATLNFYELLALRARMHFWNTPLVPVMETWGIWVNLMGV